MWHVPSRLHLSRNLWSLRAVSKRRICEEQRKVRGPYGRSAPTALVDNCLACGAGSFTDNTTSGTKCTNWYAK